ncbi:ABC transporter substrate-binding protein [Sphingobacteriales bacterium UPWRP_1]|nr:ABC transporter substrate-binding protein [Sphingobacteriales bacterium TSM_CSM]PSJ75112.1 ABC transporter substrate-binding protein [Sphingobacteriales bacterium UPWRP_1]
MLNCLFIPASWFYVALLWLLLCFSCKNPSGKKEGAVLRYNQPGGITSLDPAFAKDQANTWAVNQLYNGLVQLNDSLQIMPCLAKNWNISPDGLTYTFTLRNDVYFHDHEIFEGGKGPKLTAADVAYSLGRLIDKEVASPGAWLFNGKVEEKQPFTALNDTVFQLRLKQPFHPMLNILSMQYCYVVPQKIVQHYGKEFRNHPVGTGPFRFKTWRENEALILTANRHYFETDAQNTPLPYIDGIKITFTENKRTAFLQFLNGNLDFISGIDATYKDDVLTPDGQLQPALNGKVLLLRSPQLITEYLGFLLGTSGNPALQNKKVRQAIGYGIDRPQLIRYLRNNIGTPASQGFIPKGMPAFNPQTPGFTYQPEKARRLLKEAGFEGGKGLPPITLEITPAYQDLCTAIQKQLSEVGIAVTLELNPPSLLREKTAKGDAAFFRASWIADYADAESFLAVLYGNNPAPPNYTRFNNPQYNQRYQAALAQSNPQERHLIYQQSDQILMEEAPVIPLFYDEVLRFTHPNIENLGINPLNLLNCKQVKIK